MIARILPGRQMTTINQLSAANSISDGDQFPIFSIGQGDARRVPASLVREFIQAGLELPEGLFNASGLYSLGLPDNVGVGTFLTGGVLAVPTFGGLTNLANLLYPGGADSMTPTNTFTLEYTATRDLINPRVDVNMAMTFAAARRLTLQMQVGPLTSLYDTPLAWSAVGQDANQMYAHIGGYLRNPNNVSGAILAGERIRMAWKFDTAALTSITLQSLTMKIQTLDGV